MKTGRRDIVYVVERFLFGIREFVNKSTHLLDQSKIEHKLTHWELSFLSINLVGEYKSGFKEINTFLGKCIFWGFTVPSIFILADIMYFRVLIPFISVFGFVGWRLLPSLKLLDEVRLTLHEVSLSKRQEKRLVEPTYSGLGSAELLCDCDGHRLYLHGTNPKQIVFGPMFLISSCIFILVVFYGEDLADYLISGLAVLLTGIATWLPHRHGVLFDRDHQTVMFIRGWLRKPLVIPFSAIKFIDYVEDGINFGRDLIVLSTLVPGRRKRPIRLPLSTAMGNSRYAMCQAVGAIHCFMDQENTRAMPRAIKNSIEWFRRHDLTMRHFNWRPLPEDDLYTYQKADSLYHADLVDPSDTNFMEYVLPEGRVLLAREALLEEYLDAVWENLSLEQVEPELIKRTQDQILQSDIDEAINRRLLTDRYENINVYEEFNGGEIGPASELSHGYFKFVTALGKARDPIYISEQLEAIKNINCFKKKLLSEGKLTEEQYKKSFLYGIPKY
ncbi:hypothetical protein KO489_00395 [Reinekea forsetii]|nr:hypothetical protein [Reinekea forsetii]